MSIVRPALKGDITKLKANFFNNYRDGDHVFFILATDSKENSEFVDDEVRASWSPNWAQANAVFESQIDTNYSFTLYNNTMLFIWDGNYNFISWKNCIDRIHTENYERRVSVDVIILEPQLDNIPNLLTAMYDINK